MQSLVDKGLARRENLFLMQQRLTDLEARSLDAETGIYRAQQEISKLNRDETDLIAARRLETLRELQATEAEIDRLAIREAVNRRGFLQRNRRFYRCLLRDPDRVCQTLAMVLD